MPMNFCLNFDLIHFEYKSLLYRPKGLLTWCENSYSELNVPFLKDYEKELLDFDAINDVMV